jgi:hypothetical protein
MVDVLIALSIALGGAIALSLGEPRINRRILWAALAIVSIVLLGEVFPRFAYDQAATGFAGLQAYGGRGGSGYLIGDPFARTMVQQLVFTPIGLVFVFLRPTLFEISIGLSTTNFGTLSRYRAPMMLL